MRRPDFIIGNPDDPYLERWWVIPRNRWFNVYLHHFLHSDDDRALHDHPWVNCSILLKGSYLEHLSDGGVKQRKAWRPWTPWRMTFRWPTSAHRVELFHENTWRPDEHLGIPCRGSLPVWTLFLTGPTIREWGFICPNGWKHWKAFTKPGAPGQIGPGCND
jgi:hypothetical protein